MGVGDWLGRGKDPVLQHLIDTCRLRPGPVRGTLEGSVRGVALRVPEKQSFAKGIGVELGDCAGDACFGFFRPDANELREAVDFGADGMTRWEQGEGVRLGSFFIDYEGDARWRVLLERHALEAADYLAIYSPALDWVYFHSPGLALRLAAPKGDARGAPDLAGIERDVMTSVRLLEFLRDAAAKLGLAP